MNGTVFKYRLDTVEMTKEYAYREQKFFPKIGYTIRSNILI